MLAVPRFRKAANATQPRAVAGAGKAHVAEVPQLLRN